MLQLCLKQRKLTFKKLVLTKDNSPFPSSKNSHFDKRLSAKPIL